MPVGGGGENPSSAPGMPQPSGKTAWDFLPQGWTTDEFQERRVVAAEDAREASLRPPEIISHYSGRVGYHFLQSNGVPRHTYIPIEQADFKPVTQLEHARLGFITPEMQRVAEDTPFRLTLISNRGTQVWPTGSVFTECVDYYRVRFELREGVLPGQIGQSRAVALMDKIAEKFSVCSFELLRTFDGVKGYSLAQGQ